MFSYSKVVKVLQETESFKRSILLFFKDFILVFLVRYLQALLRVMDFITKGGPMQKKKIFFVFVFVCLFLRLASAQSESLQSSKSDFAFFHEQKIQGEEKLQSATFSVKECTGFVLNYKNTDWLVTAKHCIDNVSYLYQNKDFNGRVAIHPKRDVMAVEITPEIQKNSSFAHPSSQTFQRNNIFRR